MKKYIKYLLITLTLLSCASNEEFKKKKMKVNDCVYFNQQRIYIIDERLDDFLLYSEVNHMKFVFVEKQEKVQRVGIRVDCPSNMKENVFEFIENHY